MRFLHTADWHVGKSLAGRSRAEEHSAVLSEIVALAGEREVDLTIVAGDLFDSSSPGPEAERIVYRALLDLAGVAPVVVIPGNHDNERRLDALASLLELGNVHVGAFIDDSGPFEVSAGGDTAKIALLPWLSQRYVVKADQLMAKEGYELTGDYRARMARIVELLTRDMDGGTVNILAGHVTIAGASIGSGGERSAQTIFDYWVDPTVFPTSLHYVALGHLHKPQKMPGQVPIHYCGAPLHLDFSDDEGERRVNLVDTHPGKPAEVTEVALTSGRRLRTLSGTLEQLQALAGRTGDDHLRVIVKEKARTGLGDEVRELFEHAVKIIVEAPDDGRTGRPERPVHASPQELFGAYLAERDIDDPALVAGFTELYEECSA